MPVTSSAGNPPVNSPKENKTKANVLRFTCCMIICELCLKENEAMA